MSKMCRRSSSHVLGALGSPVRVRQTERSRSRACQAVPTCLWAALRSPPSTAGGWPGFTGTLTYLTTLERCICHHWVLAALPSSLRAWNLAGWVREWRCSVQKRCCKCSRDMPRRSPTKTTAGTVRWRWIVAGLLQSGTRVSRGRGDNLSSIKAPCRILPRTHARTQV